MLPPRRRHQHHRPPPILPLQHIFQNRPAPNLKVSLRPPHARTLATRQHGQRDVGLIAHGDFINRSRSPINCAAILTASSPASFAPFGNPPGQITRLHPSSATPASPVIYRRSSAALAALPITPM